MKNMKSLLDFCNEQYIKNKAILGNYSELTDFIDDNSKCIDIIYDVLVFPKVKDKNRSNITKKQRASHIFISFLTGLGIGKFNELLDRSNFLQTEEYNSDILWMLTSLIHDFGYFNKKFENVELNFEPNLLTDDYISEPLTELSDYSRNFGSYITFDYDTIIKYYNLKSTGILDPNEKVDHGIFGGCKYFASFIEFIYDVEEPDRKFYLQLYKTACLMAAQHNIFIPTSENKDIYINAKLEKLISLKITLKNPLLLLLSIIDTIECTKRFSREENGEKGY